MIRGIADFLNSFLIEGAATIVVGFCSYFLLPNSPETCKFLTPDEKVILRRRLDQDAGTKEGHVINNGERFDMKYLVKTLTDWRILIAGVIVCGQSIPFYAFSFFCPTIIKELGYETWQAQLLTVPIYLLACVATLVLAIYADSRQTRWKFIVYPYATAAVGFVALLSIPHPKLPGLTYGFLYLIPLGRKYSIHLSNSSSLIVPSVLRPECTNRVVSEQPCAFMAESHWPGRHVCACQSWWFDRRQHLPRERGAQIPIGVWLQSWCAGERYHRGVAQQTHTVED